MCEGLNLAWVCRGALFVWRWLAGLGGSSGGGASTLRLMTLTREARSPARCTDARRAWSMMTPLKACPHTIGLLEFRDPNQCSFIECCKPADVIFAVLRAKLRCKADYATQHVHGNN